MSTTSRDQLQSAIDTHHSYGQAKVNIATAGPGWERVRVSGVGCQTETTKKHYIEVRVMHEVY